MTTPAPDPEAVNAEDVFDRIRAELAQSARSAPLDVEVPSRGVAGSVVLHVTDPQREVFGESRAFALAQPRFVGWIRAASRGIAQGDAALAAELEHVALVELGVLDPSRWDSSDDPWVKHALRQAMRRAAGGRR